MDAGRNMNTNMASESETESDSSEQERDGSRQMEELVPKRGASSVAWTWFGYEKTQTRKLNLTANYTSHWSPQQPQTPQTSSTTYESQRGQRV